LRAANLPIGVSLLCPAFVDTGISSSERNRPTWLSAKNPLAEEYAARVKRAIESGKLTAADVAAATIEAVKADRFYVLPHRRIKAAVEIRLNDVLEDRQPTNTSAD